MNKRLKKKTMNRIGRQRVKEILALLPETLTLDTLQIEDGEFLIRGGYFIFCHLTLKQTPDWIYGIWMDRAGYRFFGEHKELVDKFRPGRCYDQLETTDIATVIPVLLDIAACPEYHFVASLVYDADDLTPEQRQERRDYYYAQKQERLEKEVAERNTTYDYVRNLPVRYPQILLAGIENQNRNGWHSFPQYYLRLILEKPFPGDEEQFLQTIETELRNIDNVILESSYSKDERLGIRQLYLCYPVYDKDGLAMRRINRLTNGKGAL